MPPSHRAFGLLCAAFMAWYADTAQAAEWKRLDSAHYTTYAQLNETKAREFVTQLELLHALTLRLIGAGPAATQPVETGLEIFLHPGRNADENEIRGLYSRALDGDCLEVTGLVSSSIRASPARRGEQQLVQETMVLRLMMGHAPMSYPQRWHAKGFARYLAATDFSEGQVYLGGVHAEAANALTLGRWLPYETVLLDGPETSVDRSMFDAQAWLLVHYLMSSAAGQQQLAAYLERQAAGEEPIAAFQAATGLSMPEWDRRLRRYADEGLKKARVRPDLLPAVVIRSTTVEAQTARHLRLRPALRCWSRTPEEGRALRQELQSLVAGAGPAADTETKLNLARADLLAGEPAAAAAALEALSQAEPGSSEAHLLLGRAYRQQSATLKGDEQRATLERAQQPLQRALHLIRNPAPAQHELAQVLAGLGKLTPALAAAREARRSDPASWTYALHEARLSLQAGDAQSAVTALETMAYQTWSPELARRAKSAIAALQAGRPTIEVLPMLKESRPLPAAAPASAATPSTTAGPSAR